MESILIGSAGAYKIIWVDVVYIIFLLILFGRLVYLIHFDLPNGGWEQWILWSGFALYIAYRLTYTL